MATVAKKNVAIKLVKQSKSEKVDVKSDTKSEKKLRRLSAVRSGFLKLVRTVLQITSVIIVMYLTATILLPTVGGELASSVGLTGQTHFYNMLSDWGVPMLFITLVATVGDIYLCKFIIKAINKNFEPRIDSGLKLIEK
jgi:hypothetical protein